MLVSDYLGTGIENARTARQIAAFFDCTPRQVTIQIERERRQGQPICASCDAAQPGYYLAEGPQDLQRYCDKLRRRSDEIDRTRQALETISL